MNKFRLLIGVSVVSLTFVFVTGPTPASAQSADYTTSWEATDLIVARLKLPTQNNQASCLNAILGNYGTPANSEVAIGVARWTVRGQMSGSTRYKELWSTSTVPQAFTYGGTWNGSCQNFLPKLNGNSSQTDWLWGFADNRDLGVSALEFRTVPTASALTNISNRDPLRVANIGKTTSCQDTNRCLYTTGPYSWVTFHEWDEARNGKHVNVGSIIPLKWTVTGFLCEPGDNRCN